MKVIPFDTLAEKSFEKGLKFLNSDFNLSVRYIQKACMLNQHNWEYRFKLACLNSDACKYDEANKLFKQVMFIEPTKTICYFLMGCNYTGMEMYEKAVVNFRKYIFTDKEGMYFKESFEFIEKLNYKCGSNESDTKTLKQLICEAEEYLRKNDYEMAIEKFEKILMDSPLIIKVRNVLSLLYFYVGRVNDAIFMAESVLKIDSHDIHANRNLEIYRYEQENILKTKFIHC